MALVPWYCTFDYCLDKKSERKTYQFVLFDATPGEGLVEKHKEQGNPSTLMRLPTPAKGNVVRFTRKMQLGEYNTVVTVAKANIDRSGNFLAIYLGSEPKPVVRLLVTGKNGSNGSWWLQNMLEWLGIPHEAFKDFPAADGKTVQV